MKFFKRLMGNRQKEPLPLVEHATLRYIASFDKLLSPSKFLTKKRGGFVRAFYSLTHQYSGSYIQDIVKREGGKRYLVRALDIADFFTVPKFTILCKISNQALPIVFSLILCTVGSAGNFSGTSTLCSGKISG